MDTQSSAVTEIPNFKLAKVGKDRDRKRAGASWLGGARGAGSGFTGAVGGSGGAAGLLSAKTLVILAVAAITSSGAWMLGQHSSGRTRKPIAAEKKLFSDRENTQYADTSNVIKADNSIPNSMGYVSGSLDGMTPEERAKKQADEEAARAADEAAAKKAADEEAKKANAPEPASNLPVDPATIASAAGGGKKGLADGKFGKLGSFGAGGGGLSGGAGLSGGINRNFGGSSVNTKPKINAGSMSAFRNAGKPGYSNGGHALAGKSRAKGFAKRQLDNAFTQSRQAMSASKSENASAGAASAFDNNPAGGSVIAGPGVGAGARQGAVDSGANPMVSNSGGPLTDGGAACSQGQAPDINGVCQTIKTNKSKDDAPYQWMITLAQALLAVIAVLALMCMIFKGKGWFETYADTCATIIGVLGVIVAGLGAAIMAMTGDKIMGGILCGIGALVAIVAFGWPEVLTGTNAAVANAGAAPEIGAAGTNMTAMSSAAVPEGSAAVCSVEPAASSSVMMSSAAPSTSPLGAMFPGLGL